jgi:hypothetical protein
MQPVCCRRNNRRVCSDAIYSLSLIDVSGTKQSAKSNGHVKLRQSDESLINQIECYHQAEGFVRACRCRLCNILWPLPLIKMKGFWSG